MAVLRGRRRSLFSSLERRFLRGIVDARMNIAMLLGPKGDHMVLGLVMAQS